jgi:hypothetical protein
MKTFKLIVILFALSLIHSCNNNDSTPTATTTIDLTGTPKKKFNISTIAKSIKYVPLETNDSCIIGTVNQIIICNDRYILTDVNNVNSVFCFDFNGKFITKIGNQGEGPGEYRIPDYVFYDFVEESIYILDDRGRKIIKYDKNGTFISETRLEVIADCVSKLTNERYAIYTRFDDISAYNGDNNYSNIYITDENIHIIKKFIPYSQNINSANIIGVVNPFCSFSNDSVSVIIPYDNNIYHVNSINCFPAYSIDFGKHNMPDNFFRDIITSKYSNPMFTIKYINDGNFSYLMSFMESRDWLNLNYKKNGKLTTCYYSKKTGEVFETYYPLNNDVDGAFFFPLMATDGYNFYSIVYPYTLKLLQKDNKEIKGLFTNKEIHPSKEIVKLSNLVNENDNPIIVIVSMKEIFNN